MNPLRASLMRHFSFLLLLAGIVLVSLQSGGGTLADSAAVGRDGGGPVSPAISFSTSRIAGALAAAAQDDPPAGLPEGKPVPLSVDDSVGSVAEAEGTVLVMTANDSRWRPAHKGLRLLVNTSVKTGSRGAHAATLSLHKNRQVILGPGAQVILTGEGAVRVMAGEAEVSGSQESPVTVQGPGESSQTVRGVKVFRAEDLRLTELASVPKWLQGYKESSVGESLGSLLATVDGRAVPLSMGFHRVTVDIRDQIARTVIEESFINHTKEVLEGEFVFPLPADASISGFAMWIGGELVEADVVEKERARAIYEMLLKQKKDPGLLEWTSANLFKARVYPIHHEKKIRITYTQVLPKTGNSFSYQYALRSELLRARPLDELSMDIRVWSDRPLSSVGSATHPCRVAKTENAARIQFSANGYTPDRDFEATFTTAASERPVSLVTHKRGDDGYFMLQLDSPGAAGTDGGGGDGGKGREVLIVADTSGSMTGHARGIQQAAMDALLDMLGDGDRFNLVLADLDVSFAFGGYETVSADSRRRAREAFESRGAMGWTDLARCFREILPRVGRDTVVVYLGDGTPTAGDADPARVVETMRAAYRHGAVHAIGCGNTHDASVLSAMASLGAGSWRVVGDRADAPGFVNAMLSDIERPGMRNVKVSISGMETAAVYPESLPNLPAGRQHILTGRMNPKITADASITVKGEDRGVPFEMSLTLPAAGAADNSFVPRFWARHRLDALMAAGRAPDTKEKVIRLSEEFQIITPYTSLLVLETDELREQFKVEKRLRMRDGEEFFAEGRENASYQLRRQQVLAAREWRKGLRAEVIEWLKTGGKGLYSELEPLGDVTHRAAMSGSFAYWDGGDSPVSAEATGMNPFDALPMNEALKLGENVREARTGFGGGRAKSDGGPMPAGKPMADSAAPAPAEGAAWSGDDKNSEEAQGGEEAEELVDGEDSPEDSDEDESRFEDDRVAGKKARAPSRSMERRKISYDDEYGNYGMDYGNDGMGWYGAGFGVRSHILPGGRWPWEPRPNQVLDGLFPQVPMPSGPVTPVSWPKELAELGKALSRMPTPDSLAKAGLELTITTEGFPQSKDVPPTTSRRVWTLADGSWHYSHTDLQSARGFRSWTSGGTRGAWSGAWDLARTRPAKDGDGRDWPALPVDLMGEVSGYRWGFTAVLAAGDGKRTITIRTPLNPDWRREVDIHASRAEVSEIRDYVRNELQSRAVFGAYATVGGVAWPTTAETYLGGGTHLQSRQTLAVSALAAGDAVAKVARASATAAGTLSIGELPKHLAESQSAIRAGNASMEQAWHVLTHFAATQQWSRAQPASSRILALASGKAGEARIRLALHQLRRQNEEAQALLMSLAGQVVANPFAGELARAADIESVGSASLGSAEALELFTALLPVYRRNFAADPGLERRTMNRHRQLLSTINQMDAARAVFRAMREKWPEDVSLRLEECRVLAAEGELDRALAMLREIRAGGGEGPKPEVLAQLVGTELDWLSEWGRWPEYLALLESESGKEKPVVTSSHVNRGLSILIRSDRTGEADALIEKWLATETLADAAPIARIRRLAAIHHATGNGYWLRRSRQDQRWYPMLLKLVLATATDPAQGETFGAIMGDWGFRESTEGQEAAKAVWTAVSEGAMTMEPALLRRLISVLRQFGHMPDGSDKPWEELADRLIPRWEALGEGDTGGVLRDTIQMIASPKQLLRVLRISHQREQMPHRRLETSRELLEHMRSVEWDDALPAEYMELVVGYAEDAARTGMPDHMLQSAVDSQVRMVRAFTEWAVSARAAHAENATPDVGKLNRRALTRLRESLMARARQSTHDDISAMLARHEGKPLAPWLEVERIDLGFQLKQEPTLLFNRLSALARPLATRSARGDELDWPARDRVLLGRTITLMSWLAFSTPKEPELALALRPLLDEGSGHARASIARLSLANWLVAMDQGDELRKVLSGWFGNGTEFQAMPWGRLLARIQAEQDLLPQAIATMQSVAAADGLGVDEWLQLSEWLMAVDDRNGHLEARLESHWAQNEWSLEGSIQNESWSFGNGSSMEVTEDLITRIRVMVTKSSRPSSRMWAIQRIYTHTRDFRVLQALANAVPGHTPERIYDLIQGLMQIINSIQEEATFDRMAAELARVRAGSPGATDQRGLHLLECLTARAADQLQGGQDHARRALESLKAAEKPEWLPGERARYARLLAAMGHSRSAGLLEEQVNQLGRLYAGAERGSHEALAIAAVSAGLLAKGGSGMLSRAILEFTAAIQAFRQGRGELMPIEAEWALTTLEGLHVAGGDFRAAEAIWLAELELAYPARRKWDMENRLAGIWAQAFRNGGSVSLGSGPTLFRTATQRLLADMFGKAEDRVLYQRFSRFVEFHNIVAGRDFRDFASRELARGSISQFAYGDFPKFLDQTQGRHTRDAVPLLAGAIHGLLGPEAGVKFLVTRAENERAWLARYGWDFWGSNSYNLAKWRSDAGNISQDTADRLLAVVLRELRSDLSTGDSRSRYIYSGGRWFWSEKAGDFRNTAMEVAEQVSGSEHLVMHIAAYLFHGLQRQQDAIGMLERMHGQGTLGYEGRSTLAAYLEQADQHGKALPILRALLEMRPSDYGVRTRVIACQIATRDNPGALESTKAAEAWLRENQQWYPWQVIQLAQAISGTTASRDMLVHSEGLYREAITMSFAGRKNRWTPDWTLGEWHRALAGVQSRLGKTIDAMDSAAAAIVLWAPWVEQRNDAMGTLYKVISDARDLAAVTGHVDAQVAATGLENPILRKVLGRVLAAKGQYSAALAQFGLAMLAAPEDTELFDLAVDAAVANKDWAAAERLLRARIAERPLEIAPYQRLSRMLERELANPTEAHRVATTMAEVSPNEVAGQSALGMWYLERARHEESMGRWEQVIRIKTDDPVGYLGKLRTLIRSGKHTEASTLARELTARKWPETVTDDVAELVKQVLRSETERPVKGKAPEETPSKNAERPSGEKSDEPAPPSRGEGERKSD